MKKAKDNRLILASVGIIAFLIFSIGTLQFAFGAEKDSNNLPAGTEINLVYKVNGDASKAGESFFTLEAESPDCPMPEGSVNGKKHIEITSAGTASFGQMIFKTPNVYEYAVKRNLTSRDSENASRDVSEYHVKIAVLNDGTIDQVITRTGTNTKSELIFTDTVKPVPTKITEPRKNEPEKKSSVFGNGVKTGDSFNPVIAGMIACAAFALILFIVVRRRGQKYNG